MVFHNGFIVPPVIFQNVHFKTREDTSFVECIHRPVEILVKRPFSSFVFVEQFSVFQCSSSGLDISCLILFQLQAKTKPNVLSLLLLVCLSVSLSVFLFITRSNPIINYEVRSWGQNLGSGICEGVYDVSVLVNVLIRPELEPASFCTVVQFSTN